mgnify:CR=1 FL=1
MAGEELEGVRSRLYHSNHCLPHHRAYSKHSPGINSVIDISSLYWCAGEIERYCSAPIMVHSS